MYSLPARETDRGRNGLEAAAAAGGGGCWGAAVGINIFIMGRCGVM